MPKTLNFRCPRRRAQLNTHPKLYFVTAAALSVALSTTARADKNWKTSIANGNWNVGSNWVEGAVPNSGDNIFVYFSDGSAHAITYDTSFSSNLALNLQNQGAGSVDLQLNSNLPLV